MENNIIENNLLIARFMGGLLDGEGRLQLNKNEIWLPYHGVCKYNVWGYGNGKTLNYQCDWNWLIPVTEKIESLGYEVFINGLYCRITDSGLTDLEIESSNVKSKIEAIYNTVIEFINWYNSNTENNEIIKN